MPRRIDLDEEQVGKLLGRLADSADAPTPKELHEMAAVAVSSTGPTRGVRRTRVRRSRSRLVVAMAAALLMLGAGATAHVLTGDPSPPRGLEAAVRLLFPRGHCVGADEATSLIRDKLAGLGLSDWSVAATAGVSGESCVAAGFVATERRIVLVPVSGPTVSTAMEGVAATLMNECLGKDQATELISSVLTGIGQTSFTISTDGPLAYPEEQEEAVRAHIASGCFVYSATGWGPDGQPIYYISGSDA